VFEGRGDHAERLPRKKKGKAYYQVGRGEKYFLLIREGGN